MAQTFVKPRLRIVLLLLFVPAGKKSIEIFCIAEILAQNGRSVGVGENILLEPLVVLDDVIDQCAEKENVSSRAQRGPDIGARRGTGEPRIDMNHLAAAFTRLHHPLEANRVLFRHRGAHDHDGV